MINRALDWISNHIFPPPHPMGKIAGYEIDSIHLTLTIYTLIIGIGLWWLFDNWLWLPGTILCMIMASMMHQMLWGD